MSIIWGSTLAFIATMGVNVHLGYRDTSYADAERVVADLAYLGVDHVRDRIPGAGDASRGYHRLAEAGVKFDLFLQGADLPKSVAILTRFTARHASSVAAIEGPNEVNNFAITYGKQTGNAAAVSYQNAMYAAIHATPALADIPVVDLTSYPDLFGRADVENFHLYGQGGAAPFAAAPRELIARAGKSTMITETGFHTAPAIKGFGGVDEVTQARLTLALLFDAARLGIKATYLYELIDQHPDPAQTSQEWHFGLFRNDHAPKTAATAIHNLTTILADGAAVAPDTSTTPPFRIDGLPATASMLVLRKNVQVYDVVIWDDAPIWNATARTPSVRPPAKVNLRFLRSSLATIYRPVDSATAITTHYGYDMVLNLSPGPYVVEIRDGCN